VTATSLLGLLGIEADPIRSREHILIATILGEAWKAGRDLDLAALIHAIQEPPVTRVGVMEVESFYPQKDRFALAMALNNLLAAPGFDAWLQGEPLDLGQILHTPEGKPRIAIFSVAHLGDACVGSVSEVFDAEPPFTPRGCIAQAWGVAELLRALVKTAEPPASGS